MKTMTFRAVLGVATILLTAGSEAFSAGTTDPSSYDWKTELEGTFGPSNVEVEEGSLYFLLEEHCGAIIEKYGSCFGNNPASPYGTYDFGDYPGEADRFRWRLAENQAILFIGRTPPSCRYFSFQAYPFSRHEDNLRNLENPDSKTFCDADATDACAATRHILAGRMGLNLNHLEIATDGPPDDPFDRFTVVVTTANEEVDGLIRALLPARLAELGLATDVINTDPIPCASSAGDGTCDVSDTRNLFLGTEPEDDDFIMALRVTMTESLASREEYLENPPVSVLRVTFFELAESFKPFGWDPAPDAPDPEVYNEDDYREALDWLTSTVRDAYAPGGQVKLFGSGQGDYYRCMREEDSCNAGSEDGYYSKSPEIPLDCVEGGASVWIAGVNHSRAEPYSYSSLSVLDPLERHELGFFQDIDWIVMNYPDQDPPADPALELPPYLEGSVEHFLPSAEYPRPAGLDRQVGHLFVAKISTACEDPSSPHCMAISPDDWSGDELKFQERIYLNILEVDRRPAPGNFIVSRVIVENTPSCSGKGPRLPSDCNGDDVLDISDVICLLGHLFLGRPRILPCGDGSLGQGGNVRLLDANGDGRVDISDAIWVFNYLFRGGPPPVLGTDCADIVGCEASPNCQ